MKHFAALAAFAAAVSLGRLGRLRAVRHARQGGRRLHLRRGREGFAATPRNSIRDDGKLTFAIVTHTAGNGFFDPVYVGAKVAADLIGAKMLLLGSESPVDDVAREIEILNQIIQDPTIDGLILTTPQVGAYNDIVKHMLDQGIPVATTNSFDPTIYNAPIMSHTGQSASAAAIGGAALAQCVLDKGLEGGSILFPRRRRPAMSRSTTASPRPSRRR